MSLVKAARRFDFAVIVVSPDDTTTVRGATVPTARDDVIFELGLFMGTIGPERAFMLHDRQAPPDLPSDLAGVTPVLYVHHTSGDLQAALGAPATIIETAIRRQGRLTESTRIQAISEEADEEEASLGAEASDLVVPTPGRDKRVDDLVTRWMNHSPHDSANLHAAVARLRDLGYTLALSQPRARGRAVSSYVRALRPDGANAGYMNSQTFAFVKSAHLLQGESLVQAGRYPFVSWTDEGSVETVNRVATKFMAEGGPDGARPAVP